MPDPGALVEAAAKNGISLVVCMVIIAIFAKILQWVFKFVDKLVTDSMIRLTAEVTKLSDSIQHSNDLIVSSLLRLSQDVKEGLAQIHQAAQYQREEHRQMVALMEDSRRSSEEARERILGHLKDQKCKALP